jgi:MYXO-CTERM domain-containing protein
MKKQTVVLALVLLGLPGPALAYVRTKTSAGVVTAWKSPCVKMEFALSAVPASMDAAGYLDAAQQGAAAWTNASKDAINRCSNVQLGVEAPPDVPGLIGSDGHNRILFRLNEWCRDPAPSDPADPRCYDSSALAITTVFQLKNSGEIVDTDIEVNGVNFTWADFVTRPDLESYHAHDFQGAITHEMGHVLGLEHTCYIPAWYKDGTPVPRSTDNTGTPVPTCGIDNPPAVVESTMYASVNSPEAEIGLRTLADDDVQGICDIYPYSPTFVCGAPDINHSKGGCSLAAHPSEGPIGGALALAALALILARRRR